MVFQYIFYGEKQVIRQKQSVLSELKGNYTDNQARSLMIAIQPIQIWFSSCLQLAPQLCYLCNLIFRRKIYVKSPRDWHRYSTYDYRSSEIIRC